MRGCVGRPAHRHARVGALQLPMCGAYDSARIGAGLTCLEHVSGVAVARRLLTLANLKLRAKKAEHGDAKGCLRFVIQNWPLCSG